MHLNNLLNLMGEIENCLNCDKCLVYVYTSINHQVDDIRVKGN